MKKSLRIIMAVLFVMAASLLIFDSSKVNAKNKYSFNTASKTLYAGAKSYLCDIRGTGEEADIVYRSEDESVATVSEEGEITPIAEGKTLIIADVTEKNSTYTCTMQITVRKPYTKVASKTKTMTLNSSFTFSLKRYGHTSPITWLLSGEGLAEIEAVSATDCVLTAKAPGTVSLTAVCGEEAFSFKVTIYDGEGELFIISPDSEPANSSYSMMSTYNDKTKHYYLIRSYLETLSNTNGGVLVFKKGTYEISNTLCIPSNTSIILEDGAVIKKIDETGTEYLEATASLFQTVSYSNAAIEGAFSGYNGEKNIKIIGHGSATIDLNNIKCQGVTIAHCKNAVVSGITFKNMNTYHFMEVTASKNVVIKNNFFTGCVASSTLRKEAINIDAPDEATYGFRQFWTSFDKTPDKDIYITDNLFYKVECGIGTHKYSEGSLHQNINIVGNTFIDCNNYAVRCMNWKNPVITDNSFIYSELDDSMIAIIINGTENPLITKNRFEGIGTPVSFYHWRNTGYGSEYAPIYNKLDAKYAKALKNNYLVNVTNPYYSYYTILDDFSEETIETYPIDGYSD